MNPDKHNAVVSNVYFKNDEFFFPRILLKTDYCSGNTLHIFVPFHNNILDYEAPVSD